MWFISAGYWFIYLHSFNLGTCLYFHLQKEAKGLVTMLYMLVVSTCKEKHPIRTFLRWQVWHHVIHIYYKIFWRLSYPYAFIKLWTMNHFSTDKPAGCRFHTKHGPFRRHNYMDKSMQTQSKQNMILTIQELMQKDVCQKYSLTKGNCEHVATKVRYGESFCKQVWHRGNVKIDH